MRKKRKLIRKKKCEEKLYKENNKESDEKYEEQKKVNKKIYRIKITEHEKRRIEERPKRERRNKE